MEHSKADPQELASQYWTLLETSIDGFFINVGGVIRYANPALHKLLGAASQTDLVGRPAFDIIDPRWHEVVRERMRVTRAGTGPNPPLEEQYVRLDGSRVDVEVTAVAIVYHGEDVGLITVRDLTRRREAERERQRLESGLQQSRKMEALGTLAGGVAHDFNNVLSAIIGNAELASMLMAKEDPARYHVQEVLAAAARASGLTRQVLAFSRGQPPSLHRLDLRQIVIEEISLLRAALPTGVCIREQLSDRCCPVLADAIQIHQVLLNLCTNAWQALKGGAGSITVGLVEGALPDSARTGAGGQQGYAILSVRDDGAGIDSDIQDRIFDPFFTTKGESGGTGLGLSVVHGIATAHGARVTCDSQLGEGTTFRLYFPLLPEAPAVKPARAVEAARGSGQSILFVDDEPRLVDIARRILGAQGYRVLGLSAPEDALASLRAGPLSFDLLISDVKMPGCGGIDVARVARAINPRLPIILISGFLGHDIVAEAADLGVRLTLDKPIHAHELCSAVAATLGLVTGPS